MIRVNGLYYTTGEFAELAGLNRRTLHYYDQIGLFSPDHIGENGYRYYSLYQLDRLALIVTLRDLGVSLKDIQACLESGDIEQMNTLLEQQDREIDRTIRQLQRRRKLLRDTLQENRQFVRYLDRGARRLTWPEEHWEILCDMDQTAESGKGGTIVNYLTDGPGTGLYLQSGRHFLYQKQENGSRRMPAGQWLCWFRSLQVAGNLMGQIDELEAQFRAEAAEQGIELQAGSYLEYNDNMTLGAEPEETQYFLIRAQIL